MTLLTSDAVAKLPAAIAIPAYARDKHEAGIVHIGTGAFHRAHQAVYTDAALGATGGDWRIIGASLRTPTICNWLANQDGLYTVVSRDSDAEELRVIGAIERVIFAPENPALLVDAIGTSKTRLVTLTVTEKGYGYDATMRGLDRSNEFVRADLSRPDLPPRSTAGFLVAGLRLRMQRRAGPLTILSCDNLPGNGEVSRNVVTQMAESIDPKLAGWIDSNVAFPSSMVDRITPATTDADKRYVAGALGVTDQCPVMTEKFSQWVIEDRFAAGRPGWEAGGAVFVENVEPFEKMKLRLLNGSHSAMAYLGYVSGYRYVHQVIAVPAIRRLIQTMMDREITPTLDVPDFDIEAYKEEILRRFANRSLNHETRQIAMDGTQKLPQRLLNPIRDRLAASQPIDCLALAVSAWMRYVGGPDEAGAEISIDDPLSGQLNSISSRCRHNPVALADSLLGIRAIFGNDLPADPRFRDSVQTSLIRLYSEGVTKTVGAVLAGLPDTAAS